jgi:flagellar biosynthetic protein FliO
MTPSMTEAVVPGIGWESIGLSFASLGVVCLVAWGALRLLAGRGAEARRGSGAIRVVERCSLEPRRSVYVVAVAGRHFLIGVGDGPMTVLAELDGDRLPKDQEAGAPARFAAVLVRALRPRRPSSAAAPKPEPS